MGCPQGCIDHLMVDALRWHVAVGGSLSWTYPPACSKCHASPFALLCPTQVPFFPALLTECLHICTMHMPTHPPTRPCIPSPPPHQGTPAFNAPTLENPELRRFVGCCVELRKRYQLLLAPPMFDSPRDIKWVGGHPDLAAAVVAVLGCTRQHGFVLWECSSHNLPDASMVPGGSVCLSDMVVPLHTRGKDPKMSVASHRPICQLFIAHKHGKVTLQQADATVWVCASFPPPPPAGGMAPLMAQSPTGRASPPTPLSPVSTTSPSPCPMRQGRRCMWGSTPAGTPATWCCPRQALGCSGGGWSTPPGEEGREGWLPR